MSWVITLQCRPSPVGSSASLYRTVSLFALKLLHNDGFPAETASAGPLLYAGLEQPIVENLYGALFKGPGTAHEIIAIRAFNFGIE